MGWILAIAACALLVVVIGLFVGRCRGLKHQISDAAERKREIDDFLAHFAHNLQNANGIVDALHGTARHIADMVEAEAVALYEVGDGELIASGVCGAYSLVRSGNRQLLSRQRYLFEALRNDRIRIGEGFLGEVASTRMPILIPDGSQDARFSKSIDPEELGSVMAVPLVTDNTLRGIVCAINNRRGRSIPFSRSQFERLKNMSAQVVIMQELVRGYSEMSRRDRIDQELEFARQIQFSLLPEAFPAWDQFSIYAFTRPAKEVNGDFYDFVEIDENRLLIVIGDACGKGVPACMLTAMTRSFIRSLADNFTTLEAFLVDLNRKMYRDTDAERFVTLGCCLLDKKNSLLEFARAGHTELITFVRNHIRLIYPEGPGLGILPEEFANFDTFCMAFEPGMSFLVFSDGITEAVNEENIEFGVERLQTLFRDSLRDREEPRSTVERILNEVSRFSPTQNDDQTLVIIQHTR